MPLPELKPNLIYDVGLHLGEDTSYYLKMGFDVVAFEANPELVLKCKSRFRDAIASRRLHIIEGAIAPASVGEKVLFYKNPLSVWGTIERSVAKRNAHLGHESTTIEVPRVDIGEVYRAHGIPYFLKIDIEGVDRLALEGLKQFEARPRYLSIETDKVDFAALRADLALLRDLGYTKYKPVQQGSVPGSKVMTRTLDGRQIEHTFEAHSSGPFGEDIDQPWLGFDDTLREYRTIFRRYRLFGDNSLFRRLPNGTFKRYIVRTHQVTTGYRDALPGWHDVHASL